MPIHFNPLQVNYIIMAIACLVLLVFMWKKWSFISSALSDGGNPSGTRLVGFIFAICVAFNETYTTLRTQKFEEAHLKALLIAIGVLFGLIKIVDLVAIWKGGAQNNTPPVPTIVQNSTTEKISTETVVTT